MFNLTTNLLCHKTSQQAATVQQLPSTELCLRIVWLSDGPAPRRWSPVKVSMELWARHMGRHCVVDKIVTFWGREFPFFSATSAFTFKTLLRHYAKRALTQRRMGTLLPKKLLSCRPRNDGPYDGPIIPSTPSQGSIDGGAGPSLSQTIRRQSSVEVSC